MTAIQQSDTASPTLARNAIGLPEVLFQSITHMAPAVATALSIGAATDGACAVRLREPATAGLRPGVRPRGSTAGDLRMGVRLGRPTAVRGGLQAGVGPGGLTAVRGGYR